MNGIGRFDDASALFHVSMISVQIYPKNHFRFLDPTNTVMIALMLLASVYPVNKPVIENVIVSGVKWSTRSQQLFNCNVEGDPYCVPVQAIRDCIIDCPNGTDELCQQNETLCDTHLNFGCGKCVPTEMADRLCTDRKWKNLCDEPGHFQCASTLNCLLPEWINDGYDDCGDNSDEDSCFTKKIVCDQRTTTNRNYKFLAIEDEQKHFGVCNRDEFHCLNSSECLPMHMVLDGIEQCSDGSDEKYCNDIGNLKCQNTNQPCSFNPTTGTYSCGCSFGYRRTKEGICRLTTVPRNAYDCTELQMQYPHISSGYHQVHDCSCPGGKNCKNTVLCDMKTEGGGWTVIMQRLNTKLSFNKTREQYENGFQIDKDNFWIGLNKMSILTSRCSSEFMLKLKSSKSDELFITKYSQLLVCDKASDYRIIIGSLTYSNHLSSFDGLRESRMASFRMSDELNCTVSGWGWWAVGCGKISALTAPNIAQGDYAGLSWQGHRISAVQMLIRSKARFSSYKFRNSN